MQALELEQLMTAAASAISLSSSLAERMMEHEDLMSPDNEHCEPCEQTSGQPAQHFRPRSTSARAALPPA